MSNYNWVIFDGLIYIFISFPFWFRLSYLRREGIRLYNKLSPIYTCGLTLFIIIFCLIDRSGGDYFHYKNEVSKIYANPEINNNFETVYIYLIKYIGFSYELFRLVVWGGAVWIYCIILRSLKLSGDVPLLIFVVITLLCFSVYRLSLGLAIFFLGYLLVTSKRHKSLGLILVIVSLFFHKSIFVLLLLLPFSYIVINKKVLLCLLVSIPFIVNIAKKIIFLFLLVQSDGAGIQYLSQERTSYGLAETIESILLWLAVIALNLSIFYFYTKKYKTPIELKRLYTLSILMIYISVILYLVGIGQSDIFTRIRNMAFLPWSILASYYVLNCKTKNYLIIMTLFIFWCYDIYHLFYMYYLKTLGLGV